MMFQRLTVSKFVRFISLVLFTCWIMTGNGQNIVLKGKIIDSISKKPIEMVNIYLLHNPRIGTVSNEDGRYILKLKKPDTVVFSHISYKTCLYKPSLKKSDDNIFLERRSINLKELTIKPDNQDEIKNIISNIRKHFRNNYAFWKPVYYNVFARIWDISDNRLSDFEEYFFHLYQRPPPFLPKYKILHGRAKAFTPEAIRSFGKKKSIYLAGVVDDYWLIYEGDFLKRRKSGKFHNSLLHEVVIDHYPCYHIKMVGKDKKEIWNLFVEKSTYALVKIEFDNLTNQNKGKDTGVVNFQQVKGKWYLKSSRNSYTLVAYPKDVTNRLCVYSWMNKEPLDGYVGIFRAAGIHLSKFSSGFDSKFWENNVVVPLPQQVKSQIK